MKSNKSDFSGYATRAGVKCADGRVIEPQAFVHNDGDTVPLVWQHGHNSPSNILGHAVLELKDDGVYAYGFFNESEKAMDAKESVRHGDIRRMSIYANNLRETDNLVHSGIIREVSLVIAGANPGATIDNVTIQHSDDYIEVVEDKAIIHSGENITPTDEGDNMPEGQNETGEKTLQDILDDMTEEQRDAVDYLVGAAIESVQGDDDDDDTNDDEDDSSAAHSALTHADKDSTSMSHNLFENSGNSSKQTIGDILTSDQISGILHDAMEGGSLKHALEQFALQHSVTNIEGLFPQHKLDGGVQVYDRQNEWVTKVLNGVRKIPMTRIRTVIADMTPEEARAKGYVKGNEKIEQVFGWLKRETDATTVYKKQSIDRDDLLDITDFDIVAFFWTEMRGKLMEALAEAILIGDGRSAMDPDKINEDRIRPIASDIDFYAPKVTLPSNSDPRDIVKAIIRSRKDYRGSGNPTLFTTTDFITDLLLIEDRNQRRVYETVDSLKSALRVSDVVEVEYFNQDPTVVGILVNLSDYTVGTNKGGEITRFDDFDIDFNKYKYLIETRISGSLTKPMSAIVIKREEGDVATPQSPSFNSETNEVQIPTTTGVVYSIKGEVVTGVVEIDEVTQVDASAASGYYIPANTINSWTFSPTGV
jgi:HK97 family phage prohead protease